MFKDLLFTCIISGILLFLSFIILSNIFTPYNLFSQNSETFVNEKPNKKIAFCFMIYDSINNEQLWKKFFDSADSSKYNIYIHYKENKPLTYFEDKKLAHCIPTAWGDKSLVKASNLLFKTAFEDDPQNYKFVLVSNSCIPLKSFNYIYHKLTNDNMGYINEAAYTEYYYQTGIYKKNPELFGKSGQWVILNREMVEKTTFIDEKFIDDNFNFHAPDEIYYYTMIKHNKLHEQVVKTPNLSSGATTYTYWHDMPDYPFSHDKDNASPYSFDTISTEEMDYLLAQPCLFGRKFNANCKVKTNDKNIELYEYIQYK